MEYFEELLSVQNIGEDCTENNRVPENGNTSDKVTFVNSNNTNEK
jgi:hypothetical protein